MGKYAEVLNLDKKQYLSPDCFGDGAKVVEFQRSFTAAALVIALKTAWAGDRVVVAEEGVTLDVVFGEGDGWTNVSRHFLAELLLDESNLEALREERRLARLRVAYRDDAEALSMLDRFFDPRSYYGRP